MEKVYVYIYIYICVCVYVYGRMQCKHGSKKYNMYKPVYALPDKPVKISSLDRP